MTRVWRWFLKNKWQTKLLLLLLLSSLQTTKAPADYTRDNSYHISCPWWSLPTAKCLKTHHWHPSLPQIVLLCVKLGSRNARSEILGKVIKWLLMVLKQFKVSQGDMSERDHASHKKTRTQNERPLWTELSALSGQRNCPSASISVQSWLGLHLLLTIGSKNRINIKIIGRSVKL